MTTNMTATMIPSRSVRRAKTRLIVAFGTALATVAAGSAAAWAQAQISPAMRSQAMNLAQICRSDYDRLCPNVAPGGGRILACLTAHSANLSAACRAAMPEASALAARAASTGVMPK